MNTEISAESQRTLMQVAHDAIAHGLTHDCEMVLDLQQYEPALRQPRATFVTLHLHGELRGCIGSLEAYQPLVQDVAHNAYTAAFGDPRFMPVTSREFRELDIHISILNPAEEMSFTSEEDLLSQLRPGVDGLILSDGRARGTFLPSVWEQLPQPRDFLTHLKLKAGLPVSHWSSTLRVKRYTTESFPS